MANIAGTSRVANTDHNCLVNRGAFFVLGRGSGLLLFLLLPLLLFLTMSMPLPLPLSLTLYLLRLLILILFLLSLLPCPNFLRCLCPRPKSVPTSTPASEVAPALPLPHKQTNCKLEEYDISYHVQVDSYCRSPDFKKSNGSNKKSGEAL